MKVVGRTVSALAIGLTLTAGSATLAGASGTHGGAASGKMSSFDYANLGQGYVTAVTPTSVTVQLWGGSTITYTLNASTVYTEGTLAATATALVSGDRVDVQTSSTDPTVATSITIELAELFGTVSAVSGNTITITDSEGFSRTILVGTTTTYSSAGVVATLADVVVGAKIIAQGTVDANLTTLDALTITIGSAGLVSSIHGVITAFTPTSVTVLTKESTTPVTFTLTTATTFKDERTTLSAADLSVGAKVGIKVDSAATTTALNVEIELAHVAGKVATVSGTTITLAGHKGTTRTIVVSSTTTYTTNGAAGTLADIMVGSKIRVQGMLSTDKLTLTATSVTIEHPRGGKGTGTNKGQHRGRNHA